MTKRKPSRRRATPQALAVREPQPADLAENPAQAFAQLARDKSIDPDKLEKLMTLHERILDRNAKTAFNAAFTKMSLELPVISRRGQILSKDKQSVRSRYARLEDIQRVTKPVLVANGFAIRHRTEWPREGIIRVVGILSHIEGHSEESAFEAPADKNDYRTPIQDQGSTVSYGRRYTMIDVLNLEQEGIDNDGQGDNRTGDARRSHPRKEPARPLAGGTSAAPPTRHSDGSGNDPITDAQRKRLWTIASHAGREQKDVKAWLQGEPYKLESTKLIKRRDYETIVAAIEQKGPLPSAKPSRMREIGEEG